MATSQSDSVGEASSIPCLAGSWMTAEDTHIAEKLLKAGQHHIFAAWGVDGDENKKKAFFAQVCGISGAKSPD